MTSGKDWRPLVKLKERRLGQLDQALSSCQQQLRTQSDALSQALEEEEARQSEAQSRLARLQGSFDATTMPLRASDIVTLHHLLAEAEQSSTAAGQRARQAEQRVEVEQERVKAAQLARQRGELQLDNCRQKLKTTLQELQAQQDDQQDEDAEETAVARMLRLARGG